MSATTPPQTPETEDRRYWTSEAIAGVLINPAFRQENNVRMVEGGFYWIETPTGWVVAKYESGYFYEPGKDHINTPLAISGPLTPPPNNTTKP